MAAGRKSPCVRRIQLYEPPEGMGKRCALPDPGGSTGAGRRAYGVGKRRDRGRHRPSCPGKGKSARLHMAGGEYGDGASADGAGYRRSGEIPVHTGQPGGNGAEAAYGRNAAAYRSASRYIGVCRSGYCRRSACLRVGKRDRGGLPAVYRFGYQRGNGNCRERPSAMYCRGSGAGF